MRVSYAIVFVSDMSRSVAFYRDVIGLPLRFESPHWTEFATDGATLALHGSEGPGPFLKRMVDMKVSCIQEPTNVFGARLAQYLDPDGLGISVGARKARRLATQ